MRDRIVHVKICGITNVEDALVAVDAGADLLGFIFFAKSPRYVTPWRAAEIAATVHEAADGQEGRPLTVGVFVNEARAHIESIADEVGLDYVQLHGDETPELVVELQPRAFKALRPADDEAEAQAAVYWQPGTGERPRLLMDAYDPAAYGGTGLHADWNVAAQLARRYAGFMLAGGLTADSVADAVRHVRPWGVDVASGVEAEPGRKDHGAVRRFVAGAKTALRDLAV